MCCKECLVCVSPKRSASRCSVTTTTPRLRFHLFFCLSQTSAVCEFHRVTRRRTTAGHLTCASVRSESVETPLLPPRYSRATCDLTPPIRRHRPSTPLALPPQRCCKHQNSHYLASGLTCTQTRPPPGCSSCAPTRVPADTLRLLHSLLTSPVWVHVQLLTKLCPLSAKHHHHRWRICSRLS